MKFFGRFSQSVYALVAFLSISGFHSKGLPSEIQDISVTADAPWCVDNVCIVNLNFRGFENLSQKLVSEDPALKQCGHENELNAFFNRAYDSVVGRSRLAIVVRSADGVSSRICSAARMPQFGEDSMSPRIPYVFERRKVPPSVNVRLIDRSTGKDFVQKVDVPSLAEAGSTHCDSQFKQFSGELSLRDVRTKMRTVQTYCFTLTNANALRRYFSLSTVNKANWQCSDVIMKVTSPSGVEYQSEGSQPGVSPQFEAGTWKAQTYLNFGCDRYDFHIAGI